MKRHDMRWSVADRMAALAVGMGFLLSFLWVAVPSDLFIRTVALTVEGDRVRFVRELPFGQVDAQWRAEITLIDGDGFECNSGPWNVATYQPINGNTVTYQIGSWARQCLEAGPPFYLTTTRRVLLFGAIPLRRQIDVTEVQGDRPPGPIVFLPAEG